MQLLPLISSFIIYIYLHSWRPCVLVVPLFYPIVMYIKAKRLLEWGKNVCRPGFNLVQQELIGSLLFAIAAISFEWQIAGGQMLLSRPRNSEHVVREEKRCRCKGEERLFWLNITRACELKIIIIMCTDIIYNKKNPIKKIMLTLNESHAAVVNDVISDGFYARLDALHCQTVCVSSRFVWKLDKSLKSRTFTLCLFPHLRDFIACIV